MGVDGVRDRWLGALVDLDPAGEAPGRVSWVLGSAADVLQLAGPEVAACGVDVPVGLAPSGARAADEQARALLGPGRSSSIFPTAPQPAFAVARSGTSRSDRAAADVASRGAGGAGVSTQSWGIAGKVLEVEDALRARGDAGDRVVEVHPETSFTVMARYFRLPPPPGKRTAAGVAGRLRLLGQALPTLDVVNALSDVPVGARVTRTPTVDDALDALAAACSALRFAAGHARVLGAGTDAVWSDGSPAPGRAVIVV